MSENASEFGLLATARYLPRLRLDRSEMLAQHRWMAPGLRGLAKGQRTMANWDEDTLTMAVEVGRALQQALPAVEIAELALASTTLPFADRLNAGIVAAALNIDEGAALRDCTSSTRSAVTELAAALKRAVPGHASVVLASEQRVAKPASSQEMIIGDGAAGAVVGQGQPLATFVAHRSVHADFVDHFREAGSQNDYGWEERWIRDEGYFKIAAKVIRACLSQANVQAADIAHFAMPAPLSRVNDALAKKLGIPASSVASTNHEVSGDLGSAQALSMLDQVLRDAAPSELILVVGFGSGCDALLLRRTAVAHVSTVPGAGKVEKSYMKYLSFTGQLNAEWGMRAEMDNRTALTAAWRDNSRITRFEGGKCIQCGTVQFPSTSLCVNPECVAENSQAALSFANRKARVLSHTTDYLAYTPHPPFQFGHVDFEGGGRVMMEFADTDVDDLTVGTPLRMVYRVKEYDRMRGFRRYFWKATPVRDVDDSIKSEDN